MAEQANHEVRKWLELLGEREGLTALVDGATGASWSYDQLVKEIRERIVSGRAAGVVEGEVVLISGRGGPGWVAAIGAAAALRTVLVPLIGRTPEREQELAGVASVSWKLDEEGSWHPVRKGPAAAHEVPALQELRRRRHAGMIVFTSGTTGQPKGVVHDLERHLESWRIRSRNGGPGRRILLLPRPDQIAGLDVLGRGLAGGLVVVLPQEREPESIAALIRSARVEIMPASPSFLRLMLQSESGPGLAKSPLRLVPYGSEAMPPARLERLQAAWPNVTFSPRYGTTETGAVRIQAAGPGGAGMLPVEPEVDWRIANGELQIKSPRQMLGYLNQAEEQDVLTADGWYRTGDMAESMPGGGFRLLGRRVTRINVGGRKVRPEAVESVLLQHPAVVAVKVAGIPHDLLGEQVVATVEARPDSAEPAELRGQLRRWASERLEAHEVPTRWEFGAVKVEPGSMKVHRR